MKKHDFLLYGANGYTGKLIAHMAARYQLSPVLAGRREELVMPLAVELNLPYRVFTLDDAKKVEDNLSSFTAVLNTAGPFTATAAPIIEGCLAAHTHYIDITGEIDVFELIKKYDERARQAGIMLLPGAGFDVVPTDCLALFLKKKLPDATNLKIAFTSLHGSLSHGTATTMSRHLGEGGAERVNGVIKKVPLGDKGMMVDFGETKKWVMAIPWGDISTAYHTTGIPNIETYTGVPRVLYYALSLQFLYNWLLRTRFFRSLVKHKINRRAAGPSEEAREVGKSLVWAEVSNTDGRLEAATLSGPDGYTLTAHSSLLILKKLLAGWYKPGFHTPAEMYGENLVMEVPGTSREWVKMEKVYSRRT